MMIRWLWINNKFRLSWSCLADLTVSMTATAKTISNILLTACIQASNSNS